MSSIARSLAIAALAVMALAPRPAAAHGPYGPGYWNGGVWFGLGAPIYPSSPYYYAPRPAYPAYGYPYAYAPPPYYAAPAASGGCYAGAYVCPLEGPATVGMPCSCPTRSGAAGTGRAWGQAR